MNRYVHSPTLSQRQKISFLKKILSYHEIQNAYTKYTKQKCAAYLINTDQERE